MGDTIRVRLSGIRNDCSNTMYPRRNWEKHTKLYTRSTYSCDWITTAIINRVSGTSFGICRGILWN